MGSISTSKKTGQKRYVYYDKNDTFRSLWLGDVSTAVAESFRSYADRIVNAQLMNVPIDAETSRWLADLADKFYDRLAAQGLVPARKTVPTLGECIPKIIMSRAPTVSGQTIEIWRQSEKSLYQYFKKDKKVDSITRIDAESFRSWLVSSGRFDGKGGLKPTTVWKRLQHVVAFFETMVKDGIITKNPFDGLTMSPVVDTDRNVYVDAETIYQVIDVLPCAEWRLLVALWRFGGLRGSSEPLLLKWTDILWDQKKIVVHAKKTKRYEGKATRTIPIFPELVQPLEEAFDLAEEGAVYVIERIAPAYLQDRSVDRSKLDKISANFGTIFGGYIERAGLVRWSKIINNLRASMETDLLDGKYGSLGINAIADWLGHSPKVMLTHYKRVSEEKFRQVTQHKTTMHCPQNISSNFDSTKSPQMCVSPETTRESVNFALAVYLTVHSPEQGGIGRNGAERPSFAKLTQTLIGNALTRKNRQEMAYS
jgi:integrase